MLGATLLFVDVGSLSLLLAKLGIEWWLAIALGAGVGGLTTYGAQWRYLLSRRAYRRSSRPGRYVAIASFVLAANLGGGTLVAMGMFYRYLGVRVATAGLVLLAWGKELWEGPVKQAEPL